MYLLTFAERNTGSRNQKQRNWLLSRDGMEEIREEQF
jgi:hypothetical protein